MTDAALLEVIYTCTKCGVAKPASAFKKQTRQKSRGLEAQCLVCTRARDHAYYAANPDKYRAQALAHYQGRRRKRWESHSI